MRDIRKLDAWITWLHAEHPFLFDLLALGLALLVFDFAILLNWLLPGGGH